jgi:hypothetical protein
MDKKPLRNDNIPREQLLNWPVGDKHHRVLCHPKTQPYKEAGGTVVWRDQWGAGIVKNLIFLFTKTGETVADMFCGTGTLAYHAIQMGRNVVAVDKLEQAINVTDLRLKEMKETLVHDHDEWTTSHNPISFLSTIPHWATRNLSHVGALVAKRDGQVLALMKAKEKKARDAAKAQTVADKAAQAKRKKRQKAQLAEEEAKNAKEASEAAAKVLDDAGAPMDVDDDGQHVDGGDKDGDEAQGLVDVDEEAKKIAAEDDDAEPALGTAPSSADDDPPDPPHDQSPDPSPAASPSVTRSNSQTPGE